MKEEADLSFMCHQGCEATFPSRSLMPTIFLPRKCVSAEIIHNSHVGRYSGQLATKNNPVPCVN